MNFQSTINPLASSDVGGTAGHVAAACVSACSECDCERVRDARDASCILPPTTLTPRARQIVVPQAQNLGASAAAIALVPQPSIVENAGADASEASISQRYVHFTTDPPVDDEEGWTKCVGKTAQGRARRSAKCGTSVPSVPSVPSAAVRSAGRPSIRSAAPAVRRPTRSSFHPSASVTSLDAVASPVTPSVPSAAVPLLPWEGVAYDRNGMPFHPAGVAPLGAVAPSVFIPVPTPAGVARFDAVAPSVSIPVPTPAGVAPFDAVALSVSIPVPTPAGAAPFDGVAPSVALPAHPGGVTPGNAASPVVDSASPATISRAASTNDSPIPVGASAASTNDPKSNSKSISSIDRTPLSGSYPYECGTSPSPSPVDLPVKSGIKPNAAAGTKAQPANNTIFSGDTSSDPVLLATKVKGSKKRQREKKKKNLTTDDGIISPPVLPPITYVVYDAPNVFTAKDNRAYHRDQKLKNSKYSHYVHTLTTGPEAAPTLDGSEPSTPKPLALAPRQITPQTPCMSRLEKEAAKNARNTPKAVSISPTPLPKIVEADQAPTAGIPPMPDPLDPMIFPQVTEAGDACGAAMPPVTPEPTLSPLEAVPPMQVPLTGAQITAGNTYRSRLRSTACLSRYRKDLETELPISEAIALNLAARATITNTTTSSRHGRLRKRNLVAISYATGELSTLKAVKDNRILATHVSVARRVSQTAPSVLRTSAVQELNSHLLFISEDRPEPFGSKKLILHLRQTVPASLNLGEPGLSAKKPALKRTPAPDSVLLSRAVQRQVKAATLNHNHLL